MPGDERTSRAIFRIIMSFQRQRAGPARSNQPILATTSYGCSVGARYPLANRRVDAPHLNPRGTDSTESRTEIIPLFMKILHSKRQALYRRSAPVDTVKAVVHSTHSQVCRLRQKQYLCNIHVTPNSADIVTN